MTRPRLLFDRVPGLAARFTPVDLMSGPTPITEAAALADALGLASLHLKRDDLTSALYGGSKVRALEFHLGHGSSARPILTMGPYGSHHVAATSLFGAALGREVRVVLFPQPPGPEIEETGRALEVLQTNVRRCRTLLGVPWALTRARLRSPTPCWIPPGGTSSRGVLGLAEIGLEVASAIDAGQLPMPDVVVVAAGSCGTVAGMTLGLRLASVPCRVLAVRVAPRVVARERTVRRLIAGAVRLLSDAGGASPGSLPELRWFHGAYGKGYGWSTADADRAVRAALDHGLRLETTYTGKALAALASGAFAGQRVLFHHSFSAVSPTAGAALLRSGVACLP